MNIEDQVCTLEQAKRLKEIGIKQIAAYYSTISTGTKLMTLLDPENVGMFKDWGLTRNPKPIQNSNCISRFTVAELGAMCAHCISGPAGDDGFYATPDEYAPYDLDAAVEGETLVGADPWYVVRPTQAMAIADLLIWLLEKRLLDFNEVNARLQ